MKKLFSIVLIFLLSLGSTFADWKIDDTRIFSGSGTITRCSESPGDVGSLGSTYTDADGMTAQCGSNEKLSVIVDDLASSGIDESTAIAGGSTGDIALFFWAFALFLAILGLLFYLFKGKGKGKMNYKGRRRRP